MYISFLLNEHLQDHAGKTQKSPDHSPGLSCSRAAVAGHTPDESAAAATGARRSPYNATARSILDSTRSRAKHLLFRKSRDWP